MLAIVYYTWMSSRRMANQTQIDKLKESTEKRFGRHRDRLIVLETEYKALPDHDDIQQLHDRISKVNENVSGAREDISGLKEASASLKRMVEMLR